MKAVVVLAMHSSGSSLVASILDALGVNMNPNSKAKVKWYQNYEDADFVRLNINILNKCGGEWKKPPPYERILVYRNNGEFDKSVKSLVAKRSGLWGFKDPRTAITIPIIHPHLTDPKYIVVNRSQLDIAQSLMSRGGNSSKERWILLANEYKDRIQRFLGYTESPVLPVSFDALLDKKTSRQEVERMVAFVGCGKVEKGLKRINYKRQ